MYLSRVKIDKNNRQKIKDLTHVGAYHHWVEQSFPEEVAKDVRTRKLWRIDRLGIDEYLLIVSKQQPDLQKLERYGESGTAQTTSYDSFIDSLEEDMCVRFRVKLNPVIAKSQGKNNRGRIIPLVTDEQQLNFLLERSQLNGFHIEPEDVMIVAKGHEVLKQKGGKTINLVAAEYEGMLTITDLPQFKKTLTEGFGKKKAYGFGMLTVIP